MACTLYSPTFNSAIGRLKHLWGYVILYQRCVLYVQWDHWYGDSGSIACLKQNLVRRMTCSAMQGRVDLVWTDVSEERIASIYRLENPAGEEPAWAGGSCAGSSLAERVPCIHWLAGWVSPRAGLGIEKYKEIFLPCRESNPDCPARSPSLYILSYPGSWFTMYKLFNEFNKKFNEICQIVFWYI
jgi:hypothetical protein